MTCLSCLKNMKIMFIQFQPQTKVFWASHLINIFRQSISNYCASEHLDLFLHLETHLSFCHVHFTFTDPGNLQIWSWSTPNSSLIILLTDTESLYFLSTQENSPNIKCNHYCLFMQFYHWVYAEFQWRERHSFNLFLLG